MLAKRVGAARVLSALGVLGAAGLVAARSRDRVTIFAYHRVLDIPDDARFKSDPELVSASVDGFRAQMTFVRENFTPITFAKLLACKEAGEAPPPGSAIVTFDDGFADNYHEAFPILAGLQMPATIFVSTGVIDKQQRFWFEAVARRLVLAREDVTLPTGRMLPAAASLAERRQQLKLVLRHLKQLPDPQRCAAVDRLLAPARSLPDFTAPAEDMPLTWDQVREMARGGIEFGSHTVTHPVLAQVDDAAMRAELFDSKARIEAETGRKVEVLSYPVGGAEAFDDRVRRVAREAGYRAAVAYLPGGNPMATCDWFALRRIRVERYVPIGLFRAMSILPRLFAI